MSALREIAGPGHLPNKGLPDPRQEKSPKIEDCQSRALLWAQPLYKQELTGDPTMLLPIERICGKKSILMQRVDGKPLLNTNQREADRVLSFRSLDWSLRLGDAMAASWLPVDDVLEARTPESKSQSFQREAGRDLGRFAFFSPIFAARSKGKVRVKVHTKGAKQHFGNPRKQRQSRRPTGAGGNRCSMLEQKHARESNGRGGG